MSRIAVIYWSMTGNTQAMAEAIAQGRKGLVPRLMCSLWIRLA